MALRTWMRSSSDCPEPSVPAAFILQIAVACEAAGGSKLKLLEHLEVSDDCLAEPERRVALADALAVVEQATELSSVPALILTYGLSASVTRFGPVGLAAMSCATLGDAITTSIRYTPLISSILRLHLRVTDDRGALEVEEVFPLGAAGEVLIPSLLIGLWHVGQMLTGHPLVGDIEFTVPEPSYFKEHKELAPGKVRFDQPCNRLLFDRALLDLPLLTADQSTARATREQCEQALLALSSTATLVERVQRALFGVDDQICSPQLLARQLGMSERTLKRRLAEQNTSYTELLDATRRARALELLRTSASVEEVSARLGYSDAANFTRAFRRWTGQSPRARRNTSY